MARRRGIVTIGDSFDGSAAYDRQKKWRISTPVNWRENMRHLAFALAAFAALTLSGCGGGGGNPGSTGATGTPLPTGSTSAAQLDAYLGTWASDCTDHAVDTATIARAAGTPATISIAIKTDYYTGANCSGSIVGTLTASADATATYDGTVDAAIVFTPGAAAVAAKVDKVVAGLAQHTASVSGTGVTHTTVNGQPQWCIDFGGGSTTCLKDEGSYPAQTGIAGGLYIQGNTLYELVPSGSIYNVDERFTRR
jgi:hypothetical protein